MEEFANTNLSCICVCVCVFAVTEYRFAINPIVFVEIPPSLRISQNDSRHTESNVFMAPMQPVQVKHPRVAVGKTKVSNARARRHASTRLHRWAWSTCPSTLKENTYFCLMSRTTRRRLANGVHRRMYCWLPLRRQVPYARPGRDRSPSCYWALHETD